MWRLGPEDCGPVLEEREQSTELSQFCRKGICSVRVAARYEARKISPSTMHQHLLCSIRYASIGRWCVWPLQHHSF